LESELDSIEAALLGYHQIGGQFPSVDQGLKALVSRPTKEPKPTQWVQLLRELPLDPWGRAYSYRVEIVDGEMVAFVGSSGQDLDSDHDDQSRSISP